MQSANIVGYGHFTVPNGYSIWGPVFKNIGKEVFYLSQITPCTPKGVAITGDGKVTLQIVDSEGHYGKSYAWCPAECGGWAIDGVKIKDNDVPLNPGEGFAMRNTLMVLADGTEGAGRFATPSPATMLCSGEVDLVCKNSVPYNYSISGNSTPNVIYLSQITPCTPKGVAITGDGKVTLQIVDIEGHYGKSYAWCPTECGGWALDGVKIKDNDVPLNPGEGFAMRNTLMVLADGTEGAGRFATPSPAILALPCPVAK